jgi:hypothetical protein
LTSAAVPPPKLLTIVKTGEIVGWFDTEVCGASLVKGVRETTNPIVGRFDTEVCGAS